MSFYHTPSEPLMRPDAPNVAAVPTSATPKGGKAPRRLPQQGSTTRRFDPITEPEIEEYTTNKKSLSLAERVAANIALTAPIVAANKQAIESGTIDVVPMEEELFAEDEHSTASGSGDNGLATLSIAASHTPEMTNLSGDLALERQKIADRELGSDGFVVKSLAQFLMQKFQVLVPIAVGNVVDSEENIEKWLALQIVQARRGDQYMVDFLESSLLEPGKLKSANLDAFNCADASKAIGMRGNPIALPALYKALGGDFREFAACGQGDVAFQTRMGHVIFHGDNSTEYFCSTTLSISLSRMRNLSHNLYLRQPVNMGHIEEAQLMGIATAPLTERSTPKPKVGPSPLPKERPKTRLVQVTPTGCVSSGKRKRWTDDTGDDEEDEDFAPSRKRAKPSNPSKPPAKSTQVKKKKGTAPTAPTITSTSRKVVSVLSDDEMDIDTRETPVKQTAPLESVTPLNQSHDSIEIFDPDLMEVVPTGPVAGAEGISNTVDPVGDVASLDSVASNTPPPTPRADLVLYYDSEGNLVPVDLGNIPNLDESSEREEPLLQSNPFEMNAQAEPTYREQPLQEPVLETPPASPPFWRGRKTTPFCRGGKKVPRSQFGWKVPMGFTQTDSDYSSSEESSEGQEVIKTMQGGVITLTEMMESQVVGLAALQEDRERENARMADLERANDNLKLENASLKSELETLRDDIGKIAMAVIQKYTTNQLATLRTELMDNVRQEMETGNTQLRELFLAIMNGKSVDSAEERMAEQEPLDAVLPDSMQTGLFDYPVPSTLVDSPNPLEYQDQNQDSQHFQQC